MRIDEISVFHVAMPLIDPWKTSFGEMREVDTVLVRLTSAGETGWGECAPYAYPNFCPEWAEGCFHLITNVFRPLLLGQEINSPQELQDRLGPFKGNHFAKAAIDLAWWDLSTRLQNRPLWQAIGGENPTFSVGADIPVQPDRRRLIDLVAEALDAGYPRVKLKYRRDSGVDNGRSGPRGLSGSRDAHRLQFRLHAGRYRGIPRLDRLELAMIEQPLASDDLIDHAHLQAVLETPMCLDESITSIDRARKAIESGRGPHDQHQARPRRRSHQCNRDRPLVSSAWNTLLDRRHAGIGRRPGPLHGIGHAAGRRISGRYLSRRTAICKRTCNAAYRVVSAGKMTVTDSKGCGYHPDLEMLQSTLRRRTSDTPHRIF